jgi:N-hydroxyarylamine O-acetyltransferase
MNLISYLEHIQYAKPVKPDVDSLHGLQLAHLHKVPFENLDIRLKRVIQINEPAIWNKVVVNGRG